VTAETPSDLSGLKIDRDAPAPDTTSRRIVFLAAAAFVLLAAALLLYRGLHPSPMRVQVARAEPLGGVPGANATEILIANGYVVARQRASVSTEVAGRLERLFVEEGSRVRKGQVLGVLQNLDQRSALANARAALSSAEARQAEAEATAREAALSRGRLEQLHAKALVSQSELDRAVAADEVARARVKSAEAETNSARARVQSAQVDYDKTFVRAPFSGEMAISLARSINGASSPPAWLPKRLATNPGCRQLAVTPEPAHRRASSRVNRTLHSFEC